MIFGVVLVCVCVCLSVNGSPQAIAQSGFSQQIIEATQRGNRELYARSRASSRSSRRSSARSTANFSTEDKIALYQAFIKGMLAGESNPLPLPLLINRSLWQ